MPNIAWVWNQSNLKLLHLGGAGAAIGANEKIFISNPDILFIPVGSPVNDRSYIKGYQPQQAINIIKELRPKIVFPTHYKAESASNTCPLSPIDEFLSLVQTQAQAQPNEKISLQTFDTNSLTINSDNLSQQGTSIRVLSDNSFLVQETTSEEE